MSSAELAAPADVEPGSRFLDEIREQPEALLRLLEGEAEFARIAAEIRARDATTIRMVGHGSSDNAASYGVYAFGLLPRWTALRDSISLTVYYGAELDMSGCTARALPSPDALRTSSSTRVRQSGGARTRWPSRTTRPLSSHARPTQSSSSERATSRRSPPRRRTRTRSRRSACSPRTRRSRRGRSRTGSVSSPRRDAAAHPLRRAADRERGDPVRVCGPDVRRRARSGVRDRTRDRAEAPRDVPHRSGAADGDGSRARPRCRARLAVPGLGDRLRRRRRSRPSSRRSSAPAKRARRSSPAGARRSRSPARTTCSRARRRPRPSSRRSCRSSRASSSRGRWRAHAGLDPDAPRGLSKVTLAR